MVGRLPCRVEQVRSAGCLDRQDELFALCILLDLGVETDETLQQLDEAPRLLASLLEHTRKPGSARNQVSTRTIHGDIAMTLEQTHHAADALECFSLLGGREQTHD